MTPVDREYYNVLEVGVDASLDDIKKSYRKLAVKCHPDKCSDPGAETKFKTLNEAYEALSDPESKEKYDLYGKDWKKSCGRNMGAGFADFFGGFNSFGRGQPKATRTNDTLYKVQVPLENFFNGKVKRIKISRDVICDDCKGSGGTEMEKCNECINGVKMYTRSLGQGMIQQTRGQCDKCKGSAQIVKSPCSKCSGKKMINESKILEINIQKGAMNGTEIKFDGLSNEYPGMNPGDFIVVLDQLPHPIFTRSISGSDLNMRRTITLKEALTGFNFQLRHLDESSVEVVSSDIIPPGKTVKIANEGMPVQGSSRRGDLYITYDIHFPDSLSEETIEKLKKLLP